MGLLMGALAGAAAGYDKFAEEQNKRWTAEHIAQMQHENDMAKMERAGELNAKISANEQTFKSGESAKDRASNEAIHGNTIATQKEIAQSRIEADIEQQKMNNQSAESRTQAEINARSGLLSGQAAETKAQADKINNEVDQQKALVALRTRYITETDPVKKAQLAEEYHLIVGGEKGDKNHYSYHPHLDDLGQPVPGTYDRHNQQTGETEIDQARQLPSKTANPSKPVGKAPEGTKPGTYEIKGKIFKVDSQGNVYEQN